MVCPRLGRRRVLIPILLAMSATGILTAVMPSYASFIAARVLNAFIVIAIYETAFTYLLELVGGPYSTVVGVGAEFIWVAGWLLLGGLAFAIRDWRHLVLAYSVPSLLSGQLEPDISAIFDFVSITVRLPTLTPGVSVSVLAGAGEPPLAALCGQGGGGRGDCEAGGGV